jgi:hypothetical protein
MLQYQITFQWHINLSVGNASPVASNKLQYNTDKYLHLLSVTIKYDFLYLRIPVWQE